MVQMVFRPFRPLDFDLFDLLGFDLPTVVGCRGRMFRRDWWRFKSNGSNGFSTFSASGFRPFRPLGFRPFQPSSDVQVGWPGGIGDGLKAMVQVVFRPFRPLDFDLFDLLGFDLFSLRRVSHSRMVRWDWWRFKSSVSNGFSTFSTSGFRPFRPSGFRPFQPSQGVPESDGPVGLVAV